MNFSDFKNKFQRQPVDHYLNNNVSEPLVTISVVTFQHGNYIRKCLDGILMQKTDFAFEILLGEDDSSDGTREICIDYANRYPNKIRLFLHHRENNIKIGGQPTGRFNFLYNLYSAQGKYIALCEGDDYWTDPLKLQKQVDFLEGNEGYSGCFHSTVIKNEMTKDDEKLWRTYNKNEFTIEDTFSRLSLIHTSSFLFKRESLIIPSWFSKIISGDMALFALIASQGSLSLIDEPMSVYRKNEGGITSSLKLFNYHKSRIVLFGYLNKELNYKYQKKINKIVDFHKKELTKNNKKIKLSEKRVKDRDKMKSNFVNIRLDISNLDIYYIRTSIFNAIKETLLLFQGSLLDIGCGKMPYKDHILNHSGVISYTGLDIETAKVYDKQIKPDVTWDGVTMPFNDKDFDCAFGTEVLEHCPQPEIILKEVHRVLKPGGIFFFTVPFLWNLHETPHDEYRYTPFALERHLENAGFKDIQLKATGGWHASMAQMLGLWVRRSPMSSRKRKYLSIFLKPVISSLIKLDKPEKIKFKEGQMITGIYGIVKK